MAVLLGSARFMDTLGRPREEESHGSEEGGLPALLHEPHHCRPKAARDLGPTRSDEELMSLARGTRSAAGGKWHEPTGITPNHMV